MSFSNFVSRVFGKRPVWLYRFTIGGVSYHYTSKATPYTSGANAPSDDYPAGQIWDSENIIRGEIYQTTLANRNDTWVRMLTKSDVGSIVVGDRSNIGVAVDIWQGYIGDPDEEFVLQFSGRLVEVEADLLFVTMVYETSASISAKSSVAQVVQRPCRHAHYFTNADGGGCGLDLADFQQSAEVTAITGRVVTVPLAAIQDDSAYLAGIFEYDGLEYMIQSHVGEILTLESEPPGLSDEVDAGVTYALIAPGCNLTIENCDDYSNVSNFGGFPDMTESKFNGGSIA